GSTLLLPRTSSVSVWHWATNKLGGPLTLANSATGEPCTVTALASANGATVVIGTNDTSFVSPTIPAGHGAVPCGVRRWTIATQANELLTIAGTTGTVVSTDPANAVTLNAVAQFAYSAGGHRVYARADGSVLV